MFKGTLLIPVFFLNFCQSVGVSYSKLCDGAVVGTLHLTVSADTWARCRLSRVPGVPMTNLCKEFIGNMISQTYSSSPDILFANLEETNCLLFEHLFAMLNEFCIYSVYAVGLLME